MWRRWCREEASRRELACKAELRKEKMSSLLQAVRRKGEKQPRPQQPAPPIPPSNTQQQPSSPDVSLITSKIVRQELVSCVNYIPDVCLFVQLASCVHIQAVAPICAYICKHTHNILLVLLGSDCLVCCCCLVLEASSHRRHALWLHAPNAPHPALGLQVIQ